MRRSAHSLFLLGLVTLWLAPCAWGGELERVAWWHQDWKYRKIVRVIFPPQGQDLPVNLYQPNKLLGDRSLTARAVIDIETSTEAERQITVTDAEGNLVPARAYASGWGESMTVLFKAKPEKAEYYLYYGNPNAKPTRMSWARSSLPVTVVTVPVEDAAAVMKTPAKALDAVFAAKETRGKVGTYSINYQANPFGMEAGIAYVTLYSALLVAPHAGNYEFAIGCGGTAHLLINNSLVLTASGDQPERSWKQTAQVSLSKGLHTMTILHAESSEAQGIRAGWREPGEQQIELMAGSAFARSNYVPIEVVGFEHRDKEATPFFSVDRADVAFQTPDGGAKTQLRLNNLTRGKGLTFRWQIGEIASEEHSPVVYVKAGGTCNITLEVFKGDQSMGTYQTSVNLRTLRQIKANASVELVQCPNIVYVGEKATLTFKIDNLTKVEVPLQYERIAPDGEISSYSLVLPPLGTKLVNLDIPPPPATVASAQMGFRAMLVGTKIAEHTVKVLRPGLHLAELRSELGRLVDSDGRRAVIIADLEDANRHRRWAVIRWLAAKFQPQPQRILLFGHPMLNEPDPTLAGSYVADLRRRFVLEDRTMNFAQSGASRILPCVADLPAFAAALAKHAPDLVIVSPGSYDVAQGVDRQTFARCLDVMIDMVRSQSRPSKLLIVSPPPLLSNLRASKEVAQAAAVIARQHRVGFLDLHARLTGEDDWKTQYQDASGDSVYMLYPNAETHRRIADWIKAASE